MIILEFQGNKFAIENGELVLYTEGEPAKATQKLEAILKHLVKIQREENLEFVALLDAIDSRSYLNKLATKKVEEAKKKITFNDWREVEVGSIKVTTKIPFIKTPKRIIRILRAEQYIKPPLEVFKKLESLLTVEKKVEIMTSMMFEGEYSSITIENKKIKITPRLKVLEVIFEKDIKALEDDVGKIIGKIHMFLPQIEEEVTEAYKTFIENVKKLKEHSQHVAYPEETQKELEKMEKLLRLLESASL